MNPLIQDLRYAGRQLRRYPAFNGASVGPARRAARIQPTEALRWE
jgi:hypothetical protein